MPTDDLGVRIARIKQKVQARGLKLRNRLLPANVETFEKEHGVRLPDEYRQFLIDLGNGGGDGPPTYGLEYLANRFFEKIRQPFPFTKAWVWEDEPSPSQQKIEAVENGCIYLGTDGDGIDWLLIVNGPERGRVWQRTDVGITPCDPPRDFLGWYEYWLDGGTDWWAGAE